MNFACGGADDIHVFLVLSRSYLSTHYPSHSHLFTLCVVLPPPTASLLHSQDFILLIISCTMPGVFLANTQPLSTVFFPPLTTSQPHAQALSQPNTFSSPQLPCHSPPPPVCYLPVPPKNSLSESSLSFPPTPTTQPPYLPLPPKNSLQH